LCSQRNYEHIKF